MPKQQPNRMVVSDNFYMSEQRMIERPLTREEVEKSAKDDSFGWFWPKLARALLTQDDALKRISEFKSNTEGVAAEMRVLARAARLPTSEEVKDAARP